MRHNRSKKASKPVARSLLDRIQPHAAGIDCGSELLLALAAIQDPDPYRVSFLGAHSLESISEVFESCTTAGIQVPTGPGNLVEKLWMVLQSILDPVLFRAEPNEDTGGFAVASDEDLLAFG